MRAQRLRTAAVMLAAVAAAPAATPALAAAGQPAHQHYYVAPGGDDTAAGTRGAPFATIQHALDVAPGGATVHLAAGTYRQDAVTRRPGVTITGPRAAVVRGGGAARIMQVQHDDTTLSGFTVDGLHGAADQRDGYRDKLLYVMSTTPGDGVDGLRVLGMRLANAGGECVRLRYLITHAEVAFNDVGPCGVDDFVFAGGGKNGEAIYLGTAPEQQGANGAPDARPDVSRDNRIHHNHIDTRGNECVDIKENSTANTVEFNWCTGQQDPNSAGFDARGSGNTFRWNASVGNRGAGIRFGGDTAADGVDNDAYGNLIRGNAAGGIKFQATPQGRVCGNVMSDNTGGDAVGTYAGRYAPTTACDGWPV
ncbi:DUF1565 domain-containing protein [Micromonospora aurantiaca (nom. illeg.)]|uniref:DUF1565 domain-containing protein n=1 Tax=Micromonospora aurantiaca (nom. illeg.) TaxID=47850 RepID=UPI0033EE9617